MSPCGDGEGRGRPFLAQQHKNGRLLPCHLPSVPRDVGGTSSAPVVPPSLPGASPATHSAILLRGRHPPPPTCACRAFFGGPLRGAFRADIAVGLPPSPTRYRPSAAYSSPSSRASSIVRWTLAPPPWRVKFDQSSPQSERRYWAERGSTSSGRPERRHSIAHQPSNSIWRNARKAAMKSMMPVPGSSRVLSARWT
jgi:hypothetical protein